MTPDFYNPFSCSVVRRRGACLTLWLLYPITTTETQRTQRLHREEFYPELLLSLLLRRCFRRGASTRPLSVASAAITRNRSAFEVVCSVKSKKLCTSTAKHPLNAARATPRRKSSFERAREIAFQNSSATKLNASTAPMMPASESTCR